VSDARISRVLWVPRWRVAGCALSERRGLSRWPRTVCAGSGHGSASTGRALSSRRSSRRATKC